MFTSASVAAGVLTVTGYVGSAAGQTAFANVVVEVFTADADPTGSGEGRTYLGQITANSSGEFSGTIAVPSGTLSPGANITAYGYRHLRQHVGVRPQPHRPLTRACSDNPRRRATSTFATAFNPPFETRTTGAQTYHRGVDPLELRFIVYRHFEMGAAPSRADLVGLVGSLEEVDRLLRELHERHMLVLDDRDGCWGEIRMALPFATEATNFRVITDTGAWWANCAWDSLAMIAALGTDGRIESTWADDGTPVEITIVDGRLAESEGSTSCFPPASGGTTSSPLEAPSRSFGRRTTNQTPVASPHSTRCGHSRKHDGDRLSETFAPRSVEASQRLLDDVGLTSAFWQLVG